MMKAREKSRAFLFCWRDSYSNVRRLSEVVARAANKLAAGDAARADPGNDAFCGA
jgi:hypothetical protein